MKDLYKCWFWLYSPNISEFLEFLKISMYNFLPNNQKLIDGRQIDRQADRQII